MVLHTCVCTRMDGKHAGGVFARGCGALHTYVCLHLDVCDCARRVCMGMWGFAHLCEHRGVCVSVQGVFARGCGDLHWGFCAVSCECARGSCARMGVCTLVCELVGVHVCARGACTWVWSFAPGFLC